MINSNWTHTHHTIDYEDHSAERVGSETAENTMTEQCILVVDDNMEAATSLTTLLKLMGYEAHTAHDGHQAIVMAEEIRPNLILLDIGMPQFNGFDVARHIRAEEWGKDIVLIALTGWGEEEYRRMSKEAGFDFHMIKPFNLDELKSITARFIPGVKVQCE